ncbi:MAG: hypothetical protein WDN06_14955 [Asticcacaulis sp.]
MAQLDPRRQPVRVTPMIFASALALTVGTMLWQVLQPVAGLTQPMDPAAAMALETQAYAEAAAPSRLQPAGRRADFHPHRRNPDRRGGPRRRGAPAKPAPPSTCCPRLSTSPRSSRV